MKSSREAFKIVILYFTIYFLWFLFSDKLIYLFIKNNDLTLFLETSINLFFITITSIFLYIIIKKSFSKVEDSKYKLKDTFNSLASPVIILDEDGKILMVNKTFKEKTGYSYSEINTVDKWVKKAYRENASKRKEEIMSLFTLKEIKDNNSTYTIHTKEEKEIIWQFNIAPFMKIDGKKTIISAALDITELKEKEKIMMQQSKMAAMGEILENIAHQWRQPLSAISTASTGVKLQYDLGTLNNEFLTESMDLINNSAQHLSKTIDDFRGFFKPDQKKEFFKITHTFEKTMMITGKKFKSEGITFIKDIEDFQILNYDNALVQVLLNLFNNSKDAFDENGIKDKFIFIDVYNDEYNLIIQIKDTAGGISSKIITKIFEPYFTTKHQSHGTGIGLYMCEEIISKHMQGKIKVKNKKFIYKDKKYTGAMFTITLPHTI